MAASIHHLSLEEQLLFFATSGSKNIQRVKGFMKRDISWPGLLYLANSERSELPLWNALEEAGYDTNSPQMLHLHKLAQVWLFRLGSLEQKLHQVIDLLDQSGIDVLLLKGCGTAYTAHKGFTDRPMHDLDLLVRPDQANQAWELVRDNGWTWDEKKWPREWYGEGHHHLPPLYHETGSGICLELHTDLWNPDHPFSFSTSDVWRDAIQVSAKNRKVLVPSVIHQLLHIGVHFAWSHGMHSMACRTFGDVQAIVESSQVEWDEFVEVAKQTGTDSCCYWTLRLARSLVGTPVPDTVLKSLRPYRSKTILRMLELHFVLNLLPSSTGCPSTAIRKFLWRRGVRRGRLPVGIHRTVEKPAKKETQQKSGSPGVVKKSLGYIWKVCQNHSR